MTRRIDEPWWLHGAPHGVLQPCVLACVLAGLVACSVDSEPGRTPSSGSSGGGAHSDSSVDPEHDAAQADGSDVGGDPDASMQPDGSGAGGGGSGSGGGRGGNGGHGGSGGGSAPPPGCEGLAPNTLPDELSCTGLYDDLAAKTPAPGVREFAPAYALWSDDAAKVRWIFLPEGTTIDATDPDSWRFPVGTKFWKEFQWNGRRAETRLFWKTQANLWIKTSYRWNEDETAATRFAGGLVDVAGDEYYIPSAKECDQCHKGRLDRALGFEAGLLGLPDATGLNLATLLDENLLENHTLPAALELGDDGSGAGVAALGWLHVNCGVSCHNGFSASEAYKTDLRLRLSGSQLDGSSLADADAITTAVDMPAKTPRWDGQDIIVPGDPANSLLYELISHRDPLNMDDQMPPIASRKVDPDGVEVIEAWITALGSTP